MNTHHWCKVATGVRDNPRRPASRLRRGGEIAGWIVPSATLVLLPKCPACLAAYVALFSGAGISVSTATYLRTSLLILCLTALLFLSLRRHDHGTRADGAKQQCERHLSGHQPINK
jgi:hypothetical protein